MENGNMINKKEGVRLRAVAFDMDGVLLSTDKLHFKAWQEFTHRHGIPFTEADNARLLGLSRMDSMNIVLLRAQRAYTMEEKVALCEEKNELYRSLIATLTPDFVAPEVCRCLRMLRDDGWKLALASSSKNAPLILERTELRRYFDAKVDGNDITHGKPHPEVFVKAAEALGIPPEYCAAVDDAPAVTSMCVHYERLFITGGDDGSLWFSDDFDPTNWNLSVSEAGFIDMSDGRGATLKAVSFLNYLYVFRTYGITRVTAYADQSEFSAVNLYTSSGRIVPDSITVCGDVILFLASDGMYRFDGITTTRISGAFEDAIDFTATAKGCYYNGKAYFILSADLGDGYEKTVLRVDPETRSHCFLRGGEIDDLCLLDGGSDYSLAAYSSARRAVAEISDDPRFFGEYPTRVWKSKYSGFGLPVKNKRLSALTLYCDEPTGVTVYADGREYKYAASGNGGYAYLRPNVRGDRFAVKITAGGKVSRVSDLTLTFKYFL